MISTNTLFFAEMALFSGVVILFGIREIWKLSPKQQAIEEAKALKRKEKYQREEEASRAARHAER
jgi:hypothetical protein